MKRLAMLVGAALAPLVPAQDCFDRDLGTKLGLGDDETAQGLALGFPFTFAGVAYTHVCVSSNGYVWLGPTSPTGSDYTPSAAELGAGAPRICPLWTDLDPSADGSGQVWFKALPDRAVVTWAHVYEFGTTNAVEFQVTLYANNHVDVTYGLNPALGPAWTGTVKAQDPGDPPVMLVGASPGGGAPPNEVSFAVCPFLTGADHFTEVLTTTAPFPYADMKCNWSPAYPGYAVSAVACVMNSVPLPATFDAIGKGCPFETVSVYETFLNDGTPVEPDVSGMAFTFTPNGLGGYVMTTGPARRSPTSGQARSAQPPREFVLPIAAGDDTSHRLVLPFTFPHATGAVNEIQVVSNGFLTLGRADPGRGLPVAELADMLTGPPRIAAFWYDLDPTAGGSVHAVFDPLRQTFTVIWERVPESIPGSTNTFWIELQPSGAFRIDLAEVSILQPKGVALVGYSDGFDAVQPPMSDLSMETVLDLGRRAMPLVLGPAPGALPAIGSVFRTDVTGIAPNPNGHLTFMLLGSEIGPVDLAPIGAAGCTAWLDVASAMTLVNTTFGVSATFFDVAIPESVSLLGQQLMTQASSDDLEANALSWRISNGGRWTIGM